MSHWMVREVECLCSSTKMGSWFLLYRIVTTYNGESQFYPRSDVRDTEQSI